MIFLLSISRSSSKDNIDNSCKWDNKENLPCLEIKGHISNSSKYSKNGINKIVINKNEIEKIGAVDLIDVLQSETSINITQSGPKGQQASMFMRGTGSNHTLVMINGIPINDQSSTQGLHDFGVDFIQTIQQIEIYPGSSASNFGTNAIGGAINIILTGDYKDAYSISSDKDQNYELSGNKTFIYDNSSLNIKFGTVKHETISARGQSGDENDKVVNYTSNLNYENYLDFDKRIFNHIYLRQTKSEYDNSNTNQTGYVGNNRMAILQAGFEKLNKFSNQEYIIYYNFHDREYDERGIIDSYESEVIGLKYDLSKTFNEKISIGAGSEYKYNWGYFDNNGSYEASTKGNSDNVSLYSNIGWDLKENLNISFFARNDDHKYSGNNRTYKVNLERKIDKSKIGVSYMNGLRNPTLYELFGTDNFGYSGNRNLKAEKSNTLELYSNLNINNYINTSIRAFRSNIKNNIEYVNNRYINDTDNVDLNQSGVNLNLNLNSKNMNFKIFSSFLSSKKENGSDQLRRPEKTYGVNFSKKIETNYLGDLDLNLLYNHYGKHFDTHSTNFSTIEMDSTDLVSLKIEKKLKDNSYFLKITNLLSENFQRPHGYNQDKRIIKFGLKY